MQNARRHLGHAGHARSAHELAIEFIELFRVQFLARHILENAANGNSLVFLLDHRAALPEPDHSPIGSHHSILGRVRLAVGDHLAGRADCPGRVLGVKFFLPEVWIIQPDLWRVTQNRFTLPADECEAGCEPDRA